MKKNDEVTTHSPIDSNLFFGINILRQPGNFKI